MSALFAGVAVTDLDRAVAWWDRLLPDAETFTPNDTEQVWTLGRDAHVYVVLRPADAGHAAVTLFVDDLVGFRAAAATRGLVPEHVETYDNGVTKLLYRDPDGNEVGVGGTGPVD